MTSSVSESLTQRPAPKPLQPGRRLKPLHDRVLVKRPPNARQVGTIVLVGGKREDVVISEVVSIGTRCSLRPWELAVGDFVMHPRVCGAKYDNTFGRLDDDGDLVFLHEQELMAVVDPGLVVTGHAVYDANGVCDFAQK